MNKIDTFAVAKKAIDEHTVQNKDRLLIIDERLDIFKNYCEGLDRIIDENNATRGTFFIGEGNTVVMTMHLYCLDVSTKNSDFCEIVERCVDFSIENVNFEIVMTFTFPPLWKEDAAKC